MILICSIAGAAVLIVVAYHHLRSRSPETASAVLRAVRELAAIVLVCSKAVEGVVDALQHSAHPQTAAPVGTWRPAGRPLVESWEEFDDDDQ